MTVNSHTLNDLYATNVVALKVYLNHFLIAPKLSNHIMMQYRKKTPQKRCANPRHNLGSSGG